MEQGVDVTVVVVVAVVVTVSVAIVFVAFKTSWALAFKSPIADPQAEGFFTVKISVPYTIKSLIPHRSTGKAGVIALTPAISVSVTVTVTSGLTTGTKRLKRTRKGQIL